MTFTEPSPGPGAAATVGGIGLGCLFFILLMFPVLFVWSWSGAHCEPQPACQASSSGYLTRSALLAIGPALLLGVALRKLFHWLGGKIREQEPKAPPHAGQTPWWTFIAVPLAICGGWWLVWGR